MTEARRFRRRDTKREAYKRSVLRVRAAVAVIGVAIGPASGIGQAGEVVLVVERQMDGVAERVLRFHQQAAMVEVELARAAQRIRRGDFAGRVVGEGDGLGVAVSIGAAQTALRVVGGSAACKNWRRKSRVRSSRREL